MCGLAPRVPIIVYKSYKPPYVAYFSWDVDLPDLVHAEALLAPHLLNAAQHQWLVPPTGGVAAQSSSISQQKGPTEYG